METKICDKCGIEKTIDNFYFRKEKNSYRNTCKDCKNKIRREKYQNNKEEINKKRREIYAETKDEYNAKRRNRKNSNPKSRLREQLINTINHSFERKGFAAVEWGGSIHS